MSWSDLVASTAPVFAGVVGAFFGYRTATKANKIQERTADGEAYERAVRIYEKTIDLQNKDIEGLRTERVTIEARLTCLEEDLDKAVDRFKQATSLLSRAHDRIMALENFIRGKGFVPPSPEEVQRNQ